jgi:hypothetical protein
MIRAHPDTKDATDPIPNVEIYGLTDALQKLRQDIYAATNIYTWTFLIDPTFFIDLFDTFLESKRLYSIVDHRMRGLCSDLNRTYPNFVARSWSYNRTMHEKTFLFSPQNVAWMGSHNLTRGSYTMASNRSARIVSSQLFGALHTAWYMDWERARPIPASPAD